MNASSRKPLGAVSLEQLLALNDEMAAVVRAGIPLEQGLAEFARESSGKPRRLAESLAARMSGGESLVEILEKDEATFPPVWRSVVLAGLRSGQLAAALESLSLTGRRAVELRRGMTLALIYPTIVVGMAYMAILFVMTFVVPVISQSYTQLLGTSSMLLSSASRVGAWVAVWGWLVPFMAVGVFAWWRVRSGRAMRSLSERGGRRFLLRGAGRWRWPSVRAALNDGRMATFAELLGLLDEHRVPLPQAIVLAADASGDRNMSRGARVIAERVERGERVTRREDLPSSFPPLLGWSLLAQMGQGSLQRTLATSAAMYRQRAVDAARWAALYMPIFLTVGVGGTAVLAEVLLVFVPFVNLMKQLAMP